MAVRLGKAGFEKTGAPYAVREETGTPCAPFDLEKDEYLLRVLWYGETYFRRTISCPCRWRGRLEFLKTLLYCYLTGGGADRSAGQAAASGETPREEEHEDSFLKYYDGRKAPVRKMPRLSRSEGNRSRRAGAMC